MFIITTLNVNIIEHLIFGQFKVRDFSLMPKKVNSFVILILDYIH